MAWGEGRAIENHRTAVSGVLGDQMDHMVPVGSSTPCSPHTWLKRVEITLSIFAPIPNKGLGAYCLACGVGIWVFACVQTHQIVHMKSAQCSVYQLYFN